MNSLIKNSLAVVMLLAGTWSAGAVDTLKGKNVVLVHGAFADGSSWDKVIPLLESKGLNVVAVQNPLTSLKDDVAATQRVIEQQKGPVVLVGHSWGGVVITQAGVDDRVKALVYVAAFSPDSGQSINDMLKGLPAPPWASALVKDSGGFLKLSTEAILQHFAQDLPRAQALNIAVTQGPWSANCLDEKVTEAAWHNKPSYVVISNNDHMIGPPLQETMAKRIKAKVFKADSSHVVMLSKPEAVAAAIIEAAKSID